MNAIAANVTPPRTIPAVSNPGPTNASGAGLLAKDQTRREQHAKLLRGFGLGSAIGSPVVEPTGNGSDNNHQSGRSRQIDAETDRERWNARIFGRAGKDF